MVSEPAVIYRRERETHKDELGTSKSKRLSNKVAFVAVRERWCRSDV